MRAVVVNLPEQELADRRSKGLDRWDEMWEGVLHMTPAPSLEHQRMLDEMIEFLRPCLRRAGRGRLFSGVNVFRESGAAPDYRIPDLTFVAAAREHVLQHDGIRGEGPDAVIEIRSPHDETYEKFLFYAVLGVREVIVCDRDTKEPEIFCLAGPQYVRLQPNRDGSVTSAVLGVRLRRSGGTPPRLRVEDVADASISVEI